MKKHKFFKPFMASLSVIYCTVPLVVMTSCGSQNNTPKITSLEVKHGLYHGLIEQDDELKYIVTVKPATKVYLFNGSQVPYIDVDDYVLNEMQFKQKIGVHGHNYESITRNNQTIITNLYTYATAVVDYSAQTIMFPDYDSYMNQFYDSANALAVGAAGGEDYLFPIENSVYNKPDHSLIIDLSYYHIPIYTLNDHGFLPFSLIRNILNPEPSSESWFWNGKGFYEVAPSGYQALKLYSELRKSSTVFTPEYMEFGYNLLALTLDFRWGLKQKRMLHKNYNIFQYFPHGAYETLKPYHDEIVSLEPDVSNHGLKTFFNQQCDDGGHSGYTSLNLLSTEPVETGFGPEHTYKIIVRSMMMAARKESGHDLPEGDTARIEIESSPKGKNDIAWVTMDSFKQPDHYISYDAVTEDNYKNDTVSLTIYLQKLVNAPDRKIKTVVLDLTNNGGGTVWTEYYLASYLCGGVTQKMTNPISGSYSEFTVKGKIVGDDHFTDDDKMPDDVRLYCITSNFTFSCANMLSCNLLDNKPDTKFIGDTTGGGSCFVLGGLDISLGSIYRSSSNYHTLRKNSTPSNPISVENGVTPEFMYLRNAPGLALNFYDRNYLKSKMFPE